MSTRKSIGKSVVEIGVEVTEAQLKAIVGFCRLRKIPVYVEPPALIPYKALEELEAACEGK